MTAYRVIDDHSELGNVGQLTHDQLDAFVNTTPWLVVSGAAGPMPPNARRLVAGPGITIVDGGPGSDLVISVTNVITGSTTAWMERPVGPADGVNLDFTLAHTPSPTSALMFYYDGVLQEQGADSDYLVVSGSIVRMLHSYRSGSNFRATYPY